MKHKDVLVEYLLKKQSNLCSVCGEAFIRIAPPTIDHIIPSCGGGSDNLDNLQVVHMVCNMIKGKSGYRYIHAGHKERQVKSIAMRGAGVTVEAMAKELNVSIRTVYRYLGKK